MRTPTLLFCFSLLSFAAVAQKPPVKFGDVSKEEQAEQIVLKKK